MSVSIFLFLMDSATGVCLDCLVSLLFFLFSSFKNNNLNTLHNYYRCEGKVLVLATVHETFPKPTRTRTLWISCGDVAGAAAVRKACLACPRDLPASCEYMDGTCCETVSGAGVCG